MWWLVLLATSCLATTQLPWLATPTVNVTLYVMSRCPDARICEAVFEEVVDKTQGKIQLDMAYIAAANKSEPLGYSCKHGPLECSGNAEQLCLHKHLPLDAFYANLACQNYYAEDIGKLSLTKRCLAKGEWEIVRGCIEGDEAEDLLGKNVDKTAAEGITTSCTISIASTLVHGGQRQCVVDGGVWRGCNDGHTPADFIRVIEEEWQHLRHV